MRSTGNNVMVIVGISGGVIVQSGDVLWLLGLLFVIWRGLTALRLTAAIVNRKKTRGKTQLRCRNVVQFPANISNFLVDRRGQYRRLLEYGAYRSESTRESRRLAKSEFRWAEVVCICLGIVVNSLRLRKSADLT